MKIPNISLYFLALHGIVFTIFFIVNLSLMKYKIHCWNGIHPEDCGSIFDSFYYTTATHTSIGFGDITPKNKFIRLVTSLHMIIVFVLVIVNIDVIKD